MSQSSPQPRTVELNMALQAQSTLYLWGRPEGDGQLVNLSFNVREHDPPAEIAHAGITHVKIGNPNGLRFQYVIDSEHTILLRDENAMEVTYPKIVGSNVVGPAAYSLDPTTLSGIAPSCRPNGETCFSSPDGPAWLLAEVGLMGLAIGETAFHLQLGHAGISYRDELFPSRVQVILGAKDEDNTYHAVNDREETLPWDSVDALVRVITPGGLPGDYNDDGRVNAADYVLWRNGGPLQNDPTPGVQSADYDVWRLNFGQSGSGANGVSSVVPEPSGLILALCLAAWAGFRRDRRVEIGRSSC